MVLTSRICLLTVAGLIGCSACRVSDTVVSRTNSDLPQQGRHLSRQGKTHWSYFWGLKSNDPWVAGCQLGSDMSRVRVTTNPGFIIVSFLSLGIAVPQRLEWDCAQVVRPDGQIGD